MTVTMDNVAHVRPDDAVERVQGGRRLLLWVLRFVMPVFILFTLADLNNLSLLDRAALAVCPLTWLYLERAVRGQNLGQE